MKRRRTLAAFAIAWLAATLAPAAAADRIRGQVDGGGGPIAQSAVTLWAASPSAPRKLAETQTGADGSFEVPVPGNATGDVLYLVTRGGEPTASARKGKNDAVALMAIVGTSAPERITVNEMTTIASVWTGAQFLNGSALSGHALGLRIAAGNVTNLVDLETGGLGPVIQDPLNSSQTTTLATFNTLANLLAGCVTQVQADACNQLFAAATPSGGGAPTDTLTAAENIARNPSHQAQQVFALLDAFYPVPTGTHWRPVPFIPYLRFAPSAWTLFLVYAGGGLDSLGGVAIDGDGNMWAGDNFLAGAQSTIFDDFGGGVSKLAPNGKPLSPMTLGYRGGGIDGPGFRHCHFRR